MARWQQFEREAPGLAASGRWLLSQNSGVAFLATVRKDGSPQLHPVMPHIAAGGLYVFIVDMSSKCGDLLRDGRYALHAIPAGPTNSEFLVSGHAVKVDDPDVRQHVITETGRSVQEWETLFEFDIERCLGTEWANWGKEGTWPTFTRWNQRTGLEAAPAAT
ncbi:MAG: pyridoxamine 5'-phosphate oxidase family protein [Chloroflexi bacterium]|nr:pyridoxamine 5'-phosphate oxidase family protein [Chloroflexota bacterium]